MVSAESMGMLTVVLFCILCLYPALFLSRIVSIFTPIKTCSRHKYYANNM